MRESYVPNLKVHRRRGPSARMWVTIILCVVLPPVGLMLLWGKVRCPLRGKVWISSISALIMVAELTLILSWQAGKNVVTPQVPVNYIYGEVPSPTAQAPDGVYPADPGITAGTPDADLPATVDDIIPANPMG